MQQIEIAYFDVAFILFQLLHYLITLQSSAHLIEIKHESGSFMASRYYSNLPQHCGVFYLSNFGWIFSEQEV